MNQHNNDNSSKNPRVDKELLHKFLSLQEQSLLNQQREFDLKKQELDLKSCDLENQKQLAHKNLDLLADDLKDQRKYKSKLLWGLYQERDSQDIKQTKIKILNNNFKNLTK